jgi:hypothetical protein
MITPTPSTAGIVSGQQQNSQLPISSVTDYVMDVDSNDILKATTDPQQDVMPAQSNAPEAEAVVEAEPENGVDKDAGTGPCMVDKAQDFMPEKGFKQLLKGNLMVILDQNKLGRTLRIDSARLPPSMAQAFQLPTEGPHKQSYLNAHTSGVQYLAVLPRCEGNMMPLLTCQPLHLAAPSCSQDAARDSKPDNGARNTPTSTVEANASIKREPQDNVRADSLAPENSDMSHDIWWKSYDTAFRMLCLPNINAQKCRLTDVNSAIQVIQKVIVIAKHFDFLSSVTAVFKSLTSDWVADRKLFKAIAHEPEAWLAVAVKLRSELVYKEALVHAVGRYPGLDDTFLLNELVPTIKAMSKELKTKQDHIDKRLLTLTISISVRNKNLRTDKPKHGVDAVREEVVTQHNEPVLWLMVNMWRDWIGAHCAHLQETGGTSSAISKEELKSAKLSATRLDEDLSVAGFYHTIAKGGDAYMPAEEVIKDWNTEEFSLDDPRRAKVRANLKVLKDKAREIVADLVASKLQYEDRDKLAYLTCVDVGGVPWAGVDDDEDGDEMDIDE